MTEIKLSTREEIWLALQEELRNTYPRTKAVNMIMDIEYLMDQKAKEIIEELLEKGHGGGNWRRLLIQAASQFDYE